MTATTERKPRQSRASRGTAAAADQQPKLAAVPNPSETPKAPAKPKPEPKPLAQADLGAKPVTYYFPKATLSDGTVVECAHQKYGHETEKAAKSCLSALVAQHGHRVS